MKRRSREACLLEKIRELHDHLQGKILDHRDRSSMEGMSSIAGETKSDTIYQIDKVSEEAIFEWMKGHWPEEESVDLVMEGIEEGTVVFPPGTDRSRIQWTLVVDPIDGTRHLMFDKRSAWILSGLAPYRFKGGTLQDIEVALMTELPPVKQRLADQFSAIRGEGIKSIRRDLDSGRVIPIFPSPSKATDLEHGFAGICKFFPEGKQQLCQWEEFLWKELYPKGTGRFPVIFDDECLSTGGQLYELLMGHDRMIADLRPLAFRSLGIESTGMTCHPYDICTALIAQEAGVIVEKPNGKPLDFPLDTTFPVTWVGYSNTELAQKLRHLFQKIYDSVS
jgi:hypothetical protein